MEWADETIIQLRELWDEGHSTAEIGRRLGVSKNTVVGKAHRLDLPARPSPIRRDGGQRPAAPRHRAVSSTTLKPLPSLAAPVLLPAPAPRPQAPAGALVVMEPRPVATVQAPRSAPAAPPSMPPPPRPFGRVVSCCWPIGEPGTRSFRFCDTESIPGKPYCPEHAQIAYVKVRDRREAA